jgi:hypothetical protein
VVDGIKYHQKLAADMARGPADPLKLGASERAPTTYAYLTAVKIDNFRRTKQVELTLADITILIGCNNSGNLQGRRDHDLTSARSASISAAKPSGSIS